MVITVGKYNFIIDNDERWRFEKYTYHTNKKANCNGVYLERTSCKKHFYLHREIMNCPKGMTVDHINLNTLDNRKSNLRICTMGQNLLNRNLRSNNRCGFKGVYLKKNKNRYYAQIRIDGKKYHLGSFKEPKTAYNAYCEAARIYHGEYARM